MTNEEALKTLIEIFVVSCMSAPNQEKAEAYNAALQIAHNGIEKQMQHKPADRRRLSNIADGGNCRKCKQFITQAFEFCPHCGQEIDWSDT